jgi:hypothetical protein
MMPQPTRQVGIQREGSKEIDDSKRFVEYPSSESGASSIFSDSHRSAADSFGGTHRSAADSFGGTHRSAADSFGGTGSNTLTIKTKKAPRRRSRKKSTKKTLNIF